MEKIRRMENPVSGLVSKTVIEPSLHFRVDRWIYRLVNGYSAFSTMNEESSVRSRPVLSLKVGYLYLEAPQRIQKAFNVYRYSTRSTRKCSTILGEHLVSLLFNKLVRHPVLFIILFVHYSCFHLLEAVHFLLQHSSCAETSPDVPGIARWLCAGRQPS